MSAELTALGLASLLQGAQIFTASMATARDAGVAWNIGPRDTTPELSVRTGRLRRAASNHFEALLLFAIAVVVLSFYDRGNGLTAIAAWVYLAARVAFIPAYVLGWVPWRSILYLTGNLATLVIVLRALL